MYRKILFIVVLIFLVTKVTECAECSFELHERAAKQTPGNIRVSKSERFHAIPDYINKISYDVTKTDLEMELLDEVEKSFNELSKKQNEEQLELLSKSQEFWLDYYEKETYGLNPANKHVALVSGDKKKVNAYRENMKNILEGRKTFIDNLLNDQHDLSDDGDLSSVMERIDFLQGRVEYFSEERNRPRVVAGEEAWMLFLEENDQFLMSYFSENPEQIDMYKMYVRKERLKILELQLTALERLRIEREE